MSSEHSDAHKHQKSGWRVDPEVAHPNVERPMLQRFYCWMTGHDYRLTSWDVDGATLECTKCGHQRQHKIRRPFR